MKQIRIKTYDEKKNGEKWYLKDSNNDLAFGFLRASAFSETDEDCFQRCFLRNSYENEIQIFVQQLVEGIHMEFCVVNRCDPLDEKMPEIRYNVL